MSQTIITLTFKNANGQLADQSSVVFNDATGQFGVIRTDTGANVVPPNTPLIHSSTGIYTYTITDPAPGLTYTYYVTDTQPSGAVVTFQNSVAGGSGNATSAFFTYTDFVNEYGLNNIVLWSQKDSYDKKNPVPNWGALQNAFTFADDEINGRFSNTIYAVPLNFAPNGGKVPGYVKDWAMTIAAWKLYKARGFEEKSKVEARFDREVRRVYDDMAFYEAGLNVMNAQVRTDVNVDMSASVITTTDVFMAPTNNNWGFVIADGSPIYFHL